MKVSLVQTNPQPNRALNLEQTRALMEEACRTEDPDLIVLPEYFGPMASPPPKNWPWPNQPAPPPTGWPVISPASIACSSMPAPSWRKSSMSRASGTRPLCSTGRDAKSRPIARSTCSTSSRRTARSTGESDTVKPGGEIVTYDIDGLRVGCAICYDIRFAELSCTWPRQVVTSSCCRPHSRCRRARIIGRCWPGRAPSRRRPISSPAARPAR